MNANAPPVAAAPATAPPPQKKGGGVMVGILWFLVQLICDLARYIFGKAASSEIASEKEVKEYVIIIIVFTAISYAMSLYNFVYMAWRRRGTGQNLARYIFGKAASSELASEKEVKEYVIIIIVFTAISYAMSLYNFVYMAWRRRGTGQNPSMA